MAGLPQRVRKLQDSLDRFPRHSLGHVPTLLEPLERLSREIAGVDVFVKRDDCTGLGFGGNKVRQLEFYGGQALKAGADVLLITGAVQSNFVRVAAAAAAKMGMRCHIQLEERVAGVGELHRTSGNVLLNSLFGATLHFFPRGEDEAGADANLQAIAAKLESEGATPYVIPLGADHDPVGALGYVEAAAELLLQLEERSLRIDHIVVTSGSGATHAGLLLGLRTLGSKIPVVGVCPRRDAISQTARIASHVRKLARMLEIDLSVEPSDIVLTDITLAPGYGLLNAATLHAMKRTAQTEGLLLDPVYTGKAMAGLMALAEQGELSGNVLFWHTGGQPALFAYGDLLNEG
jgi:D-cysteine desulfhydrase family pyridoxal phosphate-dependent enzyme